MDCCQRRGFERLFGRKTAARDLARLRRKGPDGTTRMMTGAIEAEGVAGATLLDIGGGVGAVQHVLLAAGAVGATSVDASDAYTDVAGAEAERRGYGERISYLRGDFVEMAPDIPTADVVMLDRVVCCYHDMRALVGLSSERAGRLYGLVYPRDTWWMRATRVAMNLAFRSGRHPFRFYVHPTRDVDALVRANGLKPRFHGHTLIWQVAVYGR